MVCLFQTRFAHEELEHIKAVFKGNITVMDTKKTAYGNLVLASDKGAVVDPRFKPDDSKTDTGHIRRRSNPNRNRRVTLCWFTCMRHQQRRLSASDD